LGLLELFLRNVLRERAEVLFIMGGLQVTDVAVPELLKKLKRGEWLVPEFQRQFVWTVSDAIELVNSIFDSRPIGMATLWEQPDESELPLEPISIPVCTENLKSDHSGDEVRQGWRVI
jgi:hypothetical protein